jgi:hypothetical protein
VSFKKLTVKENVAPEIYEIWRACPRKTPVIPEKLLKILKFLGIIFFIFQLPMIWRKTCIITTSIYKQRDITKETVESQNEYL